MPPYNSLTLRAPVVTPEATKEETASNSDNESSKHKELKVDKVYEKNERYRGIFGEYETKLVWHNIIPIVLLNLITVYGLVTFPYIQNWKSVVWGFVYGAAAGFGVTGGVHRYYCHRSFKASKFVQVLFIMLYSAAGHNPIFEWVRDHRVHHKFSETDADPHNSNRGLFFSHVGWLFLKKHPEVLRRGKSVDMSDILNDPIAQFHDRHFILLRVILCFLLPAWIPVYFWNESWYYAFISQCIGRYCVVLHITWAVNSFAHLYGSKPFDVTINPRENPIVAFMSLGEGWHNFHHTFPWDYRASEHGSLNLTLHILNFFRRFGLVYDMRQASKNLVERVVEKRGLNSHHGHHPPMEEYRDEEIYEQ